MWLPFALPASIAIAILFDTTLAHRKNNATML
jgi:hypothetical protein